MDWPEIGELRVLTPSRQSWGVTFGTPEHALNAVTHIPEAIQRQSLPQELLILAPPMTGAENDPSPVNALKLGNRKKP
jgi:hypothetical protein